MPDPRTQTVGTVCVAEESKHECKRPSGWLLQTNPGAGCIWLCACAHKGSEDGGDIRAASGRERGHPQLRQLLMHLHEKRHQSRTRLWAVSRSEKPIIQPWGLGAGRSVDIQPRYSRLPGQAWLSALGPVRRWRQHPRGSPAEPSSSEDVSTHPPMLRLTSYPRMAHLIKCWAPRGTNQRNHPGTGRDVRCVRSKRSVRTYPAKRLLLWPSDLTERHPAVLCSSQRDRHGWW